MEARATGAAKGGKGKVTELLDLLSVEPLGDAILGDIDYPTKQALRLTCKALVRAVDHAPYRLYIRTNDKASGILASGMLSRLQSINEFDFEVAESSEATLFRCLDALPTDRLFSLRARLVDSAQQQPAAGNDNKEPRLRSAAIRYIADHATRFSKLLELNVGRCPLTTDDLQLVAAALPQLRTLTLSDVQLQPRSPGQLFDASPVTQLKELRKFQLLPHTPVDVDIAWRSLLPHLSPTLDECWLCDVSLGDVLLLGKLPALRVLHASLHDDAVKASGWDASLSDAATFPALTDFYIRVHDLEYESDQVVMDEDGTLAIIVPPAAVITLSDAVALPAEEFASVSSPAFNLMALVSRMQRLHKLDIYTTAAPAVILALSARPLPESVKRLNLAFWSKNNDDADAGELHPPLAELSNAFLARLSARSPQLVKLWMCAYAGHRLTDAGFAAAARNWRHMERVHYEELCRPTKQVAREILHVMANYRHILLSNHRSGLYCGRAPFAVPAVTAASAMAFLLMCPGLKSVEFSGEHVCNEDLREANTLLGRPGCCVELLEESADTAEGEEEAAAAP